MKPRQTSKINQEILIETNKFDTVILDLSMPEFSGFEVIASLERTAKTKENKIIVMTASVISEDELDSL